MSLRNSSFPVTENINFNSSASTQAGCTIPRSSCVSRPLTAQGFQPIPGKRAAASHSSGNRRAGAGGSPRLCRLDFACSWICFFVKQPKKTQCRQEWSLFRWMPHTWHTHDFACNREHSVRNRALSETRVVKPTDPPPTRAEITGSPQSRWTRAGFLNPFNGSKRYPRPCSSELAPGNKAPPTISQTAPTVT